VDERLRLATAHVLVDDVAAPTPDEPAWHHLRRVLRVREGELVTVTDGAGRWRPCRFTVAGLVPDGEVVVEPAPRPVTIVIAPPKGDRVDWLVEKCTEVGVDRIVVITAARSVVRWDGDRGERHVARLRRVAAGAAMQSRRVWFPVVDGPVPVAIALAGAVLAEPGGRPLCPSDSAVAIGPEGGWTPAELAGREQVSLGQQILRVETAAVVAAAMLTAARVAA
jgi:16S rRNA (uracil1498-N3)-methyltransferase